MTMLLKEPEARVDEPQAEPVPVVRTCDTCGAEMAADQDWCLSCGTAAPGRLGTRPGMRAASTIVALTLALAGGAVAASYAALTDDAQREASKPAGPDASPVAQVPQTTTPAPTLSTPTTPTTPTLTTPTTPTLPQIQTPTLPNSSTPSVTPSPTLTVPSTPSNTTSTPTTTTPKSTTTTPKSTTTPAKAEPTAVALPADSVTLYDPYNRATDKGDPADAYDNDNGSAWSVTTNPTEKMGVGLLVDLESAKGIKILELRTNTPGFRAEVYGATGDERPPDILDTRWAHIKDRSRVDETSVERNKPGDGKERIVLGGGGKAYRFYVIWLTTPPDAGPTVRLANVELLA